MNTPLQLRTTPPRQESWGSRPGRLGRPASERPATCTRREFALRLAGAGLALAAGAVRTRPQEAGERPARPADVTVLNPRERVPVSSIPQA